jgi:hypothetical protein
MNKLGNKIYKSVGKLGNKFQSISTKIGDKTNTMIKKIPDLNNRAIELGNKAIQQSGALTNGLRKSTGVINAITNGLSDVIGSDVPLVGSALKVAGRTTKLIHKGANKIDDFRDKADYKLKKYEEHSKNLIEKMNDRKKQDNNMDEPNNFI